jgi:hypothetical protein
MHSRLATVATDIDQAVAQANPSAATRCGEIAASFALERVGMKDLAEISDDGLAALVASLDEEYFSVQEAVERGLSTRAAELVAFSKARAASAFAYASRGESSEAIYEAIMATDDLAELRALVFGVLNGAV